jgi:threonine aldolase
MRQVGILAAAGLVALEESPKCLHVDHANAQLLARRLKEIDGVTVRPVETNIVVFDLPEGCSPQNTAAALKARGILMNPVNNQFMRAVTHYDVSREQCIDAAGALAEILA